MVFLSEWNDSAVAVIIALFLIPVAVVYLVALGIVKVIPGSRLFFESTKTAKPLLYFLLHVSLLIVSAALVFLTIQYFF